MLHKVIVTFHSNYPGLKKFHLSEFFLTFYLLVLYKVVF